MTALRQWVWLALGTCGALACAVVVQASSRMVPREDGHCGVPGSLRSQVTLLGAATAEKTPQAEAGENIEAARDALGSSWRFPWYDGQADDVRRVRVRAPLDLPQWESRPWNPNFSWLEVVAWTAGVLLLLLLTWLLIKAYLNREQKTAGGETSAGRLTMDDAARVEALPFRIRRGALDLLGEARRHYQEGNYREAVIYLFSYQLVELDRSQFIRLTKGKTNRQYLGELRHNTALRGLLEQTMVAFEDVFFGDHDLDCERFESCWRRLDEFHELTSRKAAA